MGNTRHVDAENECVTRTVTQDGYRRLKVWEVADQLAHEVYRVTKAFPKEEQYGLVAQLRRAALSIPTNIVEGQARKGAKQLKQFTSIALGSLAEVEYLLGFAFKEGYLTDPVYQEVEGVRKRTGALLWNFSRSL